MSDLYHTLANSPFSGKLFSMLGLPQPVNLERWKADSQSFIEGDVLVGCAPNSLFLDAVAQQFVGSDATVNFAIEAGNRDFMVSAFEAAGVSAVASNVTESKKYKGLVFDASGIQTSDELIELHRFFHPVIRKMKTSGRIVVIGLTPELCESSKQHTAMRALEGFVRSMGKEVKKGVAVQLVYASSTAAASSLAGPIRFFLSPKAAYVSAQVIRVGEADAVGSDFDWNQPLAGKTALVTGAARGIGKSIAETLSRDGAKVIVLDIPQVEIELEQTAASVSGTAFVGDVTAADTPQRLVELFKGEFSGVDIVVHNAGVTRDKTLGGMPSKLWNMVIDINLSSEERINDALLEAGVINQGGRIIGVSSMAGIAGNFGQTNYACSKAGVVGMVNSLAQPLKEKGITINAVAPGFIETQMTAAIPVTIREVGRRLNSMSQGGKPVDVAEGIAFFASPAASGVTGNTMRVCGQSLLGA
ncbi:MAG: 3-oxoacyl-ACP reductase [Pseudomonadota bacterium]